MAPSMAPKIVRITKKALQVFSSDVTNEKVQELVALTSQLTARDINLDINSIRRGHVKAPVSYMEILSHPAVVVCVFVLWEGSKMPMHNHPEMHGILKVSWVMTDFFF
jgi:cysteamine dioxygenase